MVIHLSSLLYIPTSFLFVILGLGFCKTLFLLWQIILCWILLIHFIRGEKKREGTYSFCQTVPISVISTAVFDSTQAVCLLYNSFSTLPETASCSLQRPAGQWSYSDVGIPVSKKTCSEFLRHQPQKGCVSLPEL